MHMVQGILLALYAMSALLRGAGYQPVRRRQDYSLIEELVA